MNDINEDIVYEIVSYLDAVSVVRFLRTSKRLWNVSRKQRVVDLLIPYQKFIQYQQWNKGLLEAVKRNNIPEIEFFLSVGGDDIKAEEAAGLAAFNGNTSLVDYFSKFGDINWLHVFLQACEGLQQQIAERLAEKCPEMIHGTPKKTYISGIEPKLKNEKQKDLLLEAAKTGNTDAIKNFISFLSENYPYDIVIDLVIRTGHMDLTKYLYQLFKEEKGHKMMRIAAQHNQKHIIDWLVEQGCIAWDQGLLGAARGGNEELLQFFSDKGATIERQALWLVCIHGHTHLLPYFHRILPQFASIALSKAATYDHRELVLKILQQNIPGSDLNKALCAAAAHGPKSLVELFIQHGATDLDNALKTANPRFKNVVEYLKSKGAKET